MPEKPCTHDQFRVFISYSHKNLPTVKKLVEILQSNEICPMWDRKFSFGHGFHDQIKTFISHSHVFLPIITPDSSERPWVHQEIGYAMALNIPVLPIAMGSLPGEMIRELHAVQLDDDLSGAEDQLSCETFDNLINRFRDSSLAQYQCAEFTEDRAILMKKYANTVLGMGAYGYVRQKGGLSSFHIPDKVISHEDWKKRYGRVSQSKFHRRSLREERVALEKHARKKGCSLIVNPTLSYRKYGARAKILRLEYLIQFLNSMPEMLMKVAVNTEMPENESITFIGDWFLAESHSAALGMGFQQTIFTTHAPSMKARIELFDHEFSSLIEKMGCEENESRDFTVKFLEEEIERIIKKYKINT